MGDRNAPLDQEQFHIAQVQAEDMAKPDRVVDDLGWKRYPG